MPSTPGPPANAPQYTQQQVIAAITAAANKYGVPPAALIASANVESGLNPNEPGGGLFQDIVGGEASNSVFGGNPENVYNLQLSAENAAQTFAAAAKAHPGESWGQIAAAAQRPLNPTVYAQTVNSLLNDPTSGTSGNPIGATLTAKTTTSKTPATPPASTTTEAAQPGVPGVSNIGVTGDAAVANTGTASGSATLPSVQLLPPEAGVDVEHFGASPSNPQGYDLSAIPKNMLGSAEAAIKQYIDNPDYAATLNQTISEDYGYQGKWVQGIPELNGILIWAAADLDPATAAGQNMFLSAVQDTKWYQTTNQNQRAWQQAETQDPATAANALRNAQEQVLSTANQIGVTLSKATLDKIANMYASNYYTPTGILGTESGTSQGWLDQAVIDSVTTVQKSGTTPDTVASANAMATPGAAGQTTTTGANGQTVVSNGPTTGLENQGTTGITGLAATLYQDFQQVAQQYLLYNPTNPTGGLLTEQNLMDYVNSALKTYTGTGSSGLVSQFAQDATDNFTQQMMAKASQLYPSLAAPIAQGTTPQTYTQSEANLISSTLGIDASSIDFTSPQWNWVIATPTAGTNQKTALTSDQILQKITSPGFTFQGPNGQTMSYDNTNNAMQTANTVTNGLAQMFGVGGQ